MEYHHQQFIRKLGVRKRREIGQIVHLVGQIIKNGSSRGKTKYKCKVCRRTFYDTTSHRMSREQKERILKEYLNRMSIIAKVEGKPLTTV